MMPRFFFQRREFVAMTEPAMPGSQPFSRSTPRPRPGGRDDPMRPLDIRILISICTTVPVLILIISVLSTAVCCWFFHHKWRRRDLCGKGGVIILGDDLQRANQEGRLLVNVALVNVRVYVAIILYYAPISNLSLVIILLH